MTATQDELIAELQRSNAELRLERDAVRTENFALSDALAQRNSEFAERIDHQAATIGDGPVMRRASDHTRRFPDIDALAPQPSRVSLSGLWVEPVGESAHEV